MNNEELQRTEDWFESRLGKITASRLYDVVGLQKNGNYYAARENYKTELILERLTSERAPSFTNDAMQWGTDTEPMAKEAYTLETTNTIEEVGFIEHPAIPNFGASPDGKILDMFGKPLKKGLEIKCPFSATHLNTFRTKNIDIRYMYQMYAGMMCLEYDDWVFMSFDPRFPAHLQKVIIEVSITSEIKDKIEYEVIKFNKEVDQLVEELKAA